MEWSAAKQEVFKFASNMMVFAGAGSGKTAALVELYLRLIAGTTELPLPLTPDQIVAITFTEKAALEMKERIRQGMRCKIEDGEQDQPWERHSRNLSSAPIVTFHSFCSRILKENPAEAGIDPDFVVLDGPGAASELYSAVEATVREYLIHDAPEIAALLPYFQLEGIGRGMGLCEHLAELHSRMSGAGLSVEQLMEHNSNFEREALDNMARAEAMLEEISEEVTRILTNKKVGFHEKIAPIPGIIARADYSSAETLLPTLKEVRSCISGQWGKESGARAQTLATLDTLTFSAHQVKHAQFSAALFRMLERLEATYSARKALRGAIDFEDLLIKTRDLLAGNTYVRERYRREFPVVMVDEFQDTNGLQKELLELICGPGQRTFLVGDAKQSIYLFRGADVSVSQLAKAEIEDGGGKLVYFQESFRSRQGIIDFVNDFFKDVMAKSEAPFEITYGAGDVLEPKRADWDGEPTVELLKVTTEKDDDKTIAEANAIADSITAIVSGTKSAPVFSFDRESGQYLRRNAGFGDIAVLFRRFSNLKVFEMVFRRRGIPFYVVKGKGFYQSQEVLDLLNFLRFLESGCASMALLGVLRSPLCSLSDEALFGMSELPGGIPAWHQFLAGEVNTGHEALAATLPDLDRERLYVLRDIARDLMTLKDKLSVAELLETVIGRTGYASVLLTQFQGCQRVANVRKLVELSRSFDGAREGALYSFVRYLMEMVEEDASEPEAVIAMEGDQVVKMMTVHQSKGLEFPIVFIPEIGAGKPSETATIKFDAELGIGVRPVSASGEHEATLAFEAISSLRRRKELAEIRRLLYVAATRARDYLIFSGEGKGEWRNWLDGYIDSRAADQSTPLIKITDVKNGEASTAVVAATAASAPTLTVEDVATAITRTFCYRPPVAKELTFSPTALRDYRHCARKYFYKMVLGLEEGLFTKLTSGLDASSAGTTAEEGFFTAIAGELSSLDRGELMHRMLELADFNLTESELRHQLQVIAASQVSDPDCAEVERLVDEAVALISNPDFRPLLTGDYWREMPFVLSFPGQHGAKYHVRGVMDLVCDLINEIRVCDYKYRGGSRHSIAEYSFQVRLYMLALLKGLAGRQVTGTLIFVADNKQVEVELNRDVFEQELVSIMDEIAARQGVYDENAFPLRDNCSDSLCPFAARCGSMAACCQDNEANSVASPVQAEATHDLTSPTVSSAGPVLAARPLCRSRRIFSAEYKLDVLERASACAKRGEQADLLRKETLTCAHLARWRRQQAAGKLCGSAQMELFPAMSIAV